MWDPITQTHCLLDPEVRCRGSGLGVVLRIRHDEEGATLRVNNGRDFADHLLLQIEPGRLYAQKP